MHTPPAICLACAALVVLAGSPAGAHHGRASYSDEIVTLDATVTEFRFVNPHARVYVEVSDAAGETQLWMAEGDASVALRRSGWTEDQLRPGDRVEITGNPSRSGANMIGWETLTLADGTDIGGGSGRRDERLRILDASLARFRAQRGP